MVNTSQTVVATVQTPGGRPRYDGDAAIDGVPGTAAPIPLSFADTAGSTCGALLPTGRAVDVVNGVRVTCIDNGMPVVVMRAERSRPHRLRDAGRARQGRRAEGAASRRFGSIAGPMMNLGDVTDQDGAEDDPGVAAARGRRDLDAVLHPAPLPRHDRRLRRAERRHRVPAARRAGARRGRAAVGPPRRMLVEHPTGASPVLLTVEEHDGREEVTEGAIISTARALFVGQVLVPESALAARAPAQLVVSR